MRCLILSLVLSIGATAQSLPQQVLVGYWHNWTSPRPGYLLTHVSPNFDVVNVAFATPTSAGGAALQFSPEPALYATSQAFVADVRQLQSEGRKVLISIGGAAHPIHVDSLADEQAFVASLRQIVATYGFDGVDIDLEGSSLSLAAGDTDFRTPTSPRIVHFISAMRTFLQSMPPDLMLTAAPETAFVQGGQSAYAGVWGAYLPVLHALRDRLDWVQVQHYNTGSMFGRDGRIYQPATTDFHVAMADALIGGFPVSGAGTSFPPLRPDQVVIGLPASTQAAGSGYTTSNRVRSALDYLLLGYTTPGSISYSLTDPFGYAGFRGVMLWSTNWDAFDGGTYSTELRSAMTDRHTWISSESLSVTTGGSVRYSLRGGLRAAARPYLLVGTLNGTTPGTILPGGAGVLPINLDTFSVLTLGGGSAFQGFAGALDSTGRAGATMTLPPLPPAAAGVRIHTAWIAPWDFVSPASAIWLVP
jgi:chitinase